YYTEMLEERITSLCTSVSGVQEATVLLTLESGSEYVYAQNTTTGSDTSGAWDYVIIQQGEGEEAVMVTEIYPKVRGVAVVCTGGDSAIVRQTITELLSASLGISTNRIRVAGR
ncbi:MAG: stage III sporulation protein AG, partial [Clostridia bacterium]|nr:stage III sporulation protein AG [Clostridia bacterium]